MQFYRIIFNQILSMNCFSIYGFKFRTYLTKIYVYLQYIPMIVLKNTVVCVIIPVKLVQKNYHEIGWI